MRLRTSTRAWLLLPCLALSAGSLVSAAGLALDSKLNAPNPGLFAALGASVAMDGDTIVAGARRFSSDRGAAYVFERGPSGWTHAATLRPSDPWLGDEFGVSVTISGDTIVVGAHEDERGVGSVYVFERGPIGWSQTAKLVPSDPKPGGRFGSAVALQGDTLLIGAKYNRERKVFGGAVYVYRRIGGGWQHQGKFTPADVTFVWSFGNTIGFHGDRAVIGGQSTAHVFRLTSTGWEEEAELAPSDLPVFFASPVSVALHGSVAIVGADRDELLGPGTGAAYVFRRTTSGWEEEQKLFASDSAQFLEFGFTVTIEGDRAVVGSRRAKGEDFSTGAAYVFGFEDGAWTEIQKVTADDGARFDEFGSGLLIRGDRLVVGAPGDDDGRVDSGSVYVFGEVDNLPPVADSGADIVAECDTHDGAVVTLDGSGSTDADSTPGSNDDIVLFEWFENLAQPTERFIGAAEVLDEPFPIGVHAVSLRVTDTAAQSDVDDLVLTAVDTVRPVGGVTAPDPGSCHGPGALPVLVTDDFVDACDADPTRNYGAGRGFELKLTPMDGASPDQFGASVAVDGDTILVGSPGDADLGRASGSAIVFRRTETGWDEEEMLLASDGGPFDEFGRAVAIDGDTAMVGAPRDDDRGFDSGSVYVFERRDGQWVEVQKLHAADGANRDQFGYSLSIDGDLALIGAPFDSFGVEFPGAAYVFRRDDAGWNQEDKLSEGGFFAGNDLLGVSVGLDGDLAVLGMNGENAKGFLSGATLVYVYNGTYWARTVKLTATDGALGDRYGSAVAVSGSTLVSTAPFDDDGGEDSGSAYVVTRSGGSWIEQAKLTADDANARDEFGFSVAIDGDTIVVGARNRDTTAERAGAAYVYQRDGTTWRQVQRLVPSDAEFVDRFGTAVAIEGGVTVTGSPLDDDNGSGSGSAYVFESSTAGASHDPHGDHDVVLTVIDRSGNWGEDTVSFTIDTVTPIVQILQPAGIQLLPAAIGFDLVFTASDDDGARGDVVHEVVKLDGCVAYDGFAYGDTLDGLLSNETLRLDAAELCRIASRCGFTELVAPFLTVEATDCGGNIGSDAVKLQGGVALFPGVCGP